MKNIKENIVKIISNEYVKGGLFWAVIIAIIATSSLFYHSYKDEYDEASNDIYELEQEVEMLRSENEALKQEVEELQMKLDSISELSSERLYNYSEVLDEIENEASY